MNHRVTCSRHPRGWLLTIASGLTLLAATSSASAADAVPPASSGSPAAANVEQVSTVASWYGWQTLTFDAAALAMGLTLFAVNNDSRSPSSTDFLIYTTPATYLLGGPIAHLAHEHGGKALGSLGLRAALPIATGFAGVLLFAKPQVVVASGPGVGPVHSGNDFDWTLWTGVAVGAVGAAMIDATLLARERVPASPRVTVGAVTSWAPTVSILRQGATVGVQGTLF